MRRATETVESVLELTRARISEGLRLRPDARARTFAINEPHRSRGQFLKAVKQITSRKLRGQREKFCRNAT